MSFRKYYIDVVEDRSKGLSACLLKLVLVLPALVYWLIVSMRNFLYDKNIILRQRRFKIPVISLGNLTWGGTGKTSLAIFLSKMFSSKRVAVISRGYGKDEQALFKSSLAGSKAESFASLDRAGLLEKISPDYDLAVLDDAFQYRKVKPDVSILLINGLKPFGNGFLIPVGCLREPKSSVKRADIALIMQGKNKELEEKLQSINPGIKVFNAAYSPQGLKDLKADTVDREDILNKPLASFCAIGYPEGFAATLRGFGLRPVLEFVYPDHYDLGEDEFRKIEEKCAASNISRLMITAKDRQRFRFSTRLSIIVLEVSLDIEERQDFLEAVKARLA